MITEEQINHIKDQIPKFNWREIVTNLRSQKKQDGLLTWYYIIKQNDNWMYESNTEEVFIGPKDNMAVEGEEYLHLYLNNLDMPEFNYVTEYALKIDNVDYVGIHCLGPNSHVNPHNDENSYSFIINISIDTNNAFLDVDGERFTFEEGQPFLFDGDKTHYAVNNSQQDWIMFAIRFIK